MSDSEKSFNDNPPTELFHFDDDFETKTLKFIVDGKEKKFENQPLAKKVQLRSPSHRAKFEDGKLKIRQPFKILTDIWGVITSYEFRKELYEYIDANIENYIRINWETEDLKTYLQILRERTENNCVKYPDMPRLITDGCVDDLARSVKENLKFRRNNRDKSLMAMLDGIFNKIWNDGYAKKTLRPHVFPDVIPNFKKWQSDPFFIKIYTFASGPLEIQKLFLSASTQGNVAECITSGFDTHHRFKYDPNKYRGVIASLSERDPKNLFYFTDSPKKGQEARKTGMTVFIVLRPGNRKYKEEDLKKFYTIKTFDELEFYEFGAPCC